MQQTQACTRTYNAPQDEQNERLTEMNYSCNRDADGDTMINQSHHLHCAMADDGNP